MIAIDHKEKLVTVAVLGEFTLADFKEFEDLVNFKVQFGGQVNLLLDLREMIDFTDDNELQKALSKKAEAEIEYLGVGAFGENETLKQLTKNFSLWK